MLIPGTQMHIVTFIFISIEIVIFFYLLIYRLARPDNKTTSLNIYLISLLIIYNITGGLLPDPNLPGSYFVQESIAYATGFITPCYFPYYVYKAFGLEKMKFQAYKGVYLFLVLPYFIFILVFALSGELSTAKKILALPVLYALWIIYSLVKSIKYKYKNEFKTHESREELVVLFLSIASWIGLPLIDYFNLGQAIEASITNTGFLLLLSLEVKRHIANLRIEHQKLVASEIQLSTWNITLKKEVDKRTEELERINEEKTYTFINLAHETKTPLTLINNYLDEYISKKGNSEELTVIKKNIDKLSNDIVNFFDLERFNKKIPIYNHEQVSDFSQLLRDNLLLFKEFSKKRNIAINENIEDKILVKADPISIDRIIINLVENAIKFSADDCIIYVFLKKVGDKIMFSVKDCGMGILPEMRKKIFEPYYQITNAKRNMQGMGLGLPIVKKVVEDLNGDIQIQSIPDLDKGTKFTISFESYALSLDDVMSARQPQNYTPSILDEISAEESKYDASKKTLLIVEDNLSMVNYLSMKLMENYNVSVALNGNDALRKLKEIKILPDLIITDIMMDELDGYAFAKIIANVPAYNHIPFIFLSAKSTKQDKLLGLGLGAIDFIQKPFSIQELIKKIESILGNVYRQRRALLNSAMEVLSVQDLASSVNDTNKFEQNCRIYNLTAREIDIVKLISQGYKYKEIGGSLFIAEGTVTKHVQNIFEKVKVKNKIGLIKKLEV